MQSLLRFLLYLSKNRSIIDILNKFINFEKTITAMRTARLTILLLLVTTTLFAQEVDFSVILTPKYYHECTDITDPVKVKEYEEREKELRKKSYEGNRRKSRKAHAELLMMVSSSSVWEWKSKIEIDSLDYINPNSPILTKSNKEYSIYEDNDRHSFYIIRIDSIESNLVIRKNWVHTDLEELLTDSINLKKYGKLHGYIIDGQPTLVFGNSAHKLFKKTRTITMSTPYAKRIEDDSPIPVKKRTFSFLVTNNDTTITVNTNKDPFIQGNEQEYLFYIHRNLPIKKDQIIGRWKSPIKIDSLEFINPIPSILTKTNEPFSPDSGDPLSFDYIRIDTIAGRLVMFKSWQLISIETFLTDSTISNGCSKPYGYILIDGTPTLIFGNYAHIFFKVAKQIDLQSPYTPRKRENYTRRPYKIRESFFIVKDNELHQTEPCLFATQGLIDEDYYYDINYNFKYNKELFKQQPND